MSEEIIAQIRAWHRERCYAMEQRKRSDLALGAYLRTALGWRKDAAADERKAIAVLADDLITCGEHGAKAESRKTPKPNPHELAGSPEYERFAKIIGASLKARAPWDAIEADAEKALSGLAEQLPVWAAFGAEIRGFGPLSLATIVGEAGDLSNYPTVAKLWKRMGVAVVNGKRQGGLAKSASKDDWIEHGYNRERRSRMWNIGKSLVYAGGEYADLYRARKEVERQKAADEGLTVAPAGSIPKKRAAEFRSLGHIDKRAQRYMEKRLLADLWKAWRRAIEHLTPNPGMPASEIKAAA